MQRLLEQLVICINFTGLLEGDVEEIVRETRSSFVQSGFKIGEGTHKNINFELIDPEKVSDNIPSTTEVLKKYVYSCNNIDITFTKNSLDIVVAAGNEYLGFEVYKDYIMIIINQIIEKFQNIVEIVRIGIRKINSLYIKDIETVKSYFNDNIFNCVDVKNIVGDDGGKILISGTNLTMCGTEHKINLATEVQIGEAQEIVDGMSRILEVFRLIVDIDAYWDVEVVPYSDINDKLINLNSVVTSVYHKCLNSDFNEKLNQNLELPPNFFLNKC